ncbi:MAG: Crp/Fnr family transcriptional regulator, partial [Gammaproteobacteria bacterium]
MNKKDAINLFFSKFIGDSDKSLSTTFSTITTIREIEKGQILFTQGDKGEFVWFLIDGSIKLFKSNSDGKECVVRFVAPNDIFAEILFSDAQ